VISRISKFTFVNSVYSSDKLTAKPGGHAAVRLIVTELLAVFHSFVIKTKLNAENHLEISTNN